MSDRIIHHVRLMGEELKWTVVCSGQTEISGSKTIGNTGKLEQVTCVQCRIISEERLARITEEYGPRIAKIPWVRDFVNEGDEAE